MKELSAEDYKIHVLKSRIGNLVAEYETKIAEYETTLQMLRQEIETLKSDNLKAEV